jgi:hypothetical protein
MPFKPGKSGNPDGRPKLPPELKDTLRGLSPRAVEILTEIMENPESQPAARIRAAEIILNRAYGMPLQEIDATIKKARPIVFDSALEDSGATDPETEGGAQTP